MSRIKMLVMDVDGTLTDGAIYIGEHGEVMKAFDVKDGYAIVQVLPCIGVVPVIITGRKSKIVELRARELKIQELYQGVDGKITLLKEIANRYGVSPDQIAYIGDDINDLECIEYAGLTACPQDAVNDIKKKVNYICERCGGRGAVREFIEYIEAYK